MSISNIKVELQCDIKKVWETITSLENYTWRSDISKIEIAEADKRFIEYTKDGYPTQFIITAFIPYQRYEFDMENENMSGHWTGLLSESDGIVTIDFTENVKAKKLYMKPFVKAYLKKQQSLYIKDLKKALNLI
ncbi:polyketide cyclase [Candidatus Stoquefichus massiliensis]|uniref:polyketide cyclase n=1 Tax=Candidatus Stoquefichus massiliensis TaxID=1470350 RepID=UPI0004848E52|nr:polyketide cyclase [Candidatus Stoquefichus massiliensis]